MSQSSLSTYSFLPYLRQGLANNIAEADAPGRTGTRGTIQVKLKINPEKVDAAVDDPNAADTDIEKNIEIYGPGDIVGIDPNAIIKHEPRNRITNFETNYLPYIEFYDEDFPWRYTPATPDTSKHRLRPWLTLIVLKEDEFDDGGRQQGQPLPFIQLKGDPASLFPLPDQIWAWSHVHVNGALFDEGADKTTSDQTAAVLGKFQQTLAQNRDLAYSRIICPRQLEANTAYYAFLVPTFESGRLAGLGFPPEKTPGVMLTGWEAYSGGDPKEAPDQYPYYFRWQFRTATVGDFEYLVRLLQPQPADARIGNRDMDVQTPGSNLPGVTDPLLLGGALMAPFATQQNDAGTAFTKEKWLDYEDWDEPFPSPLQQGLAQFVNLAAEYEEKTAEEAHTAATDANVQDQIDALQEPGADDPDPIVTPPLYGRWHALQNRLLKDPNGREEDGRMQPNWLNELNLDPRYRVPAGYGTKIIQDNQEKYMDAAWGQVGKVIEANRKIRQAQVSKEIAAIWYSRHLLPLLTAFPEKALQWSVPVQRRVLLNSGVVLRDAPAPASPLQIVTPLQQRVTAYHAVSQSNVHTSLVSAPMRRVVRPRGKTMRTLSFNQADIRPDNLLSRVAEGTVLPTPPKTAPAGAVTTEQLATAASPHNVPAWILNWLDKYPWLRFLPLALAALLILLLLLAGPSAILWTTGLVIVGALVYLYQLLNKWYTQSRAVASSIGNEFPQPADVARLPNSPDFRITRPGDTFQPRPGTADSAEAIRFKNALFDLFKVLDAGVKTAVEPVKRPLHIDALSSEMVQAINPDKVIPKRILGTLLLPPRLATLPEESFKEVMAYPEFDIPMYKPLSDKSGDMFVPNLNLLTQNSITLLQTNQKFIESYMVGLNHEFARELLWREYPTDQRGSYFRQFWDVSSFFRKIEAATEEEREQKLKALREELRDIPEISRWKKRSLLGDHDHREKDGAKEEEVVLAIRGELLKKYPTAVVYAHKAEWDIENNQPDPSKPRKMVLLSAAEEDNPPESKVKTPLYEAKVDPDIYFFGFDLTVDEARGLPNPNDPNGVPDPGWFFVIKERPGEPRFGFDIPKEGAVEDLKIWNDLSWADIAVRNDYINMSGGKNATVQLAAAPANSPDPPDPNEPPSEAHLHWLQQLEDRHIHWNTSNQSNAAELAYIMYQVPVMIAVHAEEMLPK